MSNPFAVFDLDMSFELDQAELEKRYIELLKQYHPDRAADKDQENKFFLKSVEINEAVTILRSDLQRATYIFEQLEAAHHEQQVVKNRVSFEILQSQFELRAQVEVLKAEFDFEKYLEISEQAQQMEQSALAQVRNAIAAVDLQSLNDAIVTLKYLEKLNAELAKLQANEF